MTSARLQSLSRTSPAFLDDAPGRGCPCPHRRTFAVALRAFTLSEASALRHPWLRWPPTPTPGARAASPTPSAGRQKTKERSGPVSRVLFRGPLQARGGDHFSRTPVARGLQQPTRKLKRGGSPRVASALAGRTTSSCLALLPMGFSEPGRSPGLLVSSYLTVSPLPAGPKPDRRFAFCGTFPGLAAGGRYPPSRPVEPGLSSRRGIPAGIPRGSGGLSRPAVVRPAPFPLPGTVSPIIRHDRRRRDAFDRRVGGCRFVFAGGPGANRRASQHVRTACTAN